MKKITFLLFLLTVSLVSGQVVLEDFEGTTEITSGNGLAGASVVANPDDASDKVMEVISAAAGESWQQADLVMQNNYIDLATSNTVTVSVKSDQTFTMMAKVDDGANGAAAGAAAQSYTGGSGWQTLTFTFDASLDGLAVASGEYKKISFFPNWNGDKAGTNTTNADWNNSLDFTLYLDDVSAVAGTSLVVTSTTEILEDFEGTTEITSGNGLAGASVVANPDDASDKVMEVISAAAGESWQQADLVMQNNYIDLATSNTVTVSVKSDQTFTMMAKVDDGANGAAAGAAAQSYTGGSGWQTLTFTFDASLDGLAVASGEYKKISFFPNWNGDKAGTNTTNADWNDPLDFTLYLDDLTAVAGASLVVATTPEILENFEGTTEITSGNGLAGASVVANPDDASDKVMEVISAAAGESWQQADLVMQNNYIDLTTDKTVTVSVKSDQTFTMMAKVDDGANAAAAGAAAQSYTGGSGWQTLTFTFDASLDGLAVASGEYKKISFFPNWNGDKAGTNTTNADWNDPLDFTFYIDDVTAIPGAAIGAGSGDDSPPTTSAPTPPVRNASDVVSIYSDAYTSLAVDNWGPDWGAASARIEEITVDGGSVRVIDLSASKEFTGIDFANSPFDASSLTHMHIDYFVNNPPTGAVFSPKLSNHDGGAGETSAVIATEAITENGVWVSLDLALSSFGAASDPANLDRSAIAQIVVGAARTDLNESLKLYFDNLYFYKEGVAGINDNDILGFSMYPNPTSNRLNISAKETIQNADVFNVLGKKVMSIEINKTSESIDVSNLTSGIYLVKYNVNGSIGTAKFIKQ